MHRTARRGVIATSTTRQSDDLMALVDATSRRPQMAATTRPEPPATTELAPITKLIPTLRDGLAPIDLGEPVNGVREVHFDPRHFDYDTVNSMLRATGITPAPAIDRVHQAAADRARAIITAELAAHPQCPTVDVAVWGNMTLTVPEPAWCTRGHETDGRGEHPEDITHSSTETDVTVTRPDGAAETLLSGWIASNPYASVDSEPRAAISFSTGDCADYDVPGLAKLAAELRAAAEWVNGLSAQLAAAQSEVC
ncbi:DUF6907 domain-containing protein [Kitasatospora sp. NPDC001119]